MKTLTTFLLLIFISFKSLACEYYCGDFFDKYRKADLVLITEIDSISEVTNLKTDSVRKGYYKAHLNNLETLVIKGSLDKNLIGFYNNFICGGSWKPTEKVKVIIYAYQIDDYYQFSLGPCIHKLDYLDDYTFLKDYKNFIPTKNSVKKFEKNLELHFLLNNIQLTNKTYDTWPNIQPNKETYKFLFNHDVPEGNYVIYEVHLNSDSNLKRIKKLKGFNKTIDSKIKKNIKKIIWTKNTSRKDDYKLLLIFESIKRNFIRKATEEYNKSKAKK